MTEQRSPYGTPITHPIVPGALGLDFVKHANGLLEILVVGPEWVEHVWVQAA